MMHLKGKSLKKKKRHPILDAEVKFQPKIKRGNMNLLNH